MNKNKKGFTLVELIVVIAVLALLAVGAVLAFQGIQANARRSVLSADTNSLVSALNAANATAAARGGTFWTNTNIPNPVAESNGYRITLTVAAAGGLAAENFIVDFDTERHALRARSAVTFIAPPAVGTPPVAIPGVPGSFVVASDRIAAWGTSQDDTSV